MTIIQRMNPKKYYILVVDDDAIIRCFINDVLQELNYNILHACNSEEAIETLKTKDVDLIILDLLLPGKHGFEICAEIRKVEQWKNIPIL